MLEVVVLEEDGTQFEVREVFVIFVGIHHHIVGVLVIEILEKTLYLKCYLLLYILELGNLSVFKVPEKPVLFLDSSLISQVKNILQKVSEYLVFLERSLEVLEVSLVWFLFMVGVFKT